jgi:DNA-binding PadR family transcriptional regulator
MRGIKPSHFHILLALSEGPKHGYALMGEIEARSQGQVKLGPSSLYYSLAKLLKAGLIAEEDGPDEESDDARRRYYALTSLGRERVADETRVLRSVLSHARAMGFVGDEA